MLSAVLFLSLVSTCYGDLSFATWEPFGVINETQERAADDLNEDESLFRFDYTYSSAADGWLKLHIVPATWQDARLQCHAEGAVLASPLTEELRAAMDHARQKDGTQLQVYTGIHATLSSGTFSSIEGVPLSRILINWAKNEPNNYQNSENCLQILSNDSATNDIYCSSVYPYVCYKKQTETAMKLTECGTHDTEYKLDSRTGSCYKFHRRGLTWSEAYMTCAAEMGHLAIINSKQESEILRDLYAKTPDSGIFSKAPSMAAIGFHDWGIRGTWMTIHGQTLDEAGFSKFSPGQPDNSTDSRTGDEGEFCGSIFRSGLLNDIWCNVPVPFFCEKEPGV